jgi:hypothetical protein
MKIYGDARDWFIGPKLGLFVHWGLYAIHGWHKMDVQLHLRNLPIGKFSDEVMVIKLSGMMD